MTRGEFCYDPPQDRGKKYLLLTDGMVCIVGIWGSGAGLIAWSELPKRNKQIESEKGYI